MTTIYLVIALTVNLGFGPGTFYSHPIPFKDKALCEEAAGSLERKARDKLGGLVLKWKADCVDATKKSEI